MAAPALIPKRSGERIKTSRRDAVALTRLHRAGEVTGVWVPVVVHEAVRNLVRARGSGADDLRRKRQQLLSSLPKAVRDIAWKAQVRLCTRYRRLNAAGKKPPVVVAAIARDGRLPLGHWAGGEPS